jgi:hypothetical protein
MGHIFLRQKKWPTHTQETKDNGRKERNLMTRQVKILLVKQNFSFHQMRFLGLLRRCDHFVII